MKLTRVLKEGRVLTELAIGTQTVLSIPLDYIRYRGLEKGMLLYAYVTYEGSTILYKYSEKKPDIAYCEQRSIIAHSNNQFRVSMPGYFFTAMNHAPGDKYEIFHDNSGTLIYQRIKQ